jgi:hypothetical protein
MQIVLEEVIDKLVVQCRLQQWLIRQGTALAIQRIEQQHHKN